MGILEELQKLTDFESKNCSVLSIYLNTDPADPEQRNDAWKIHLKNEIRDLKTEIVARDIKNEIKFFKESKKLNRNRMI